ncbi:MAG: ABC transporter permease [Peptococcales bacterium]|jgi:spermidine/putrescine transport system permease protein
MKRSWLAYPYIFWALIFVVFPLFLVLAYSVIMTTQNGLEFTIKHFQRVFEPLYLLVLWRSIKLAFISTFVCLILGYPIAMILASQGLSQRNFLVVLFVIPMWMNFLARTYAWMTLLEKNGLINSLLSFLNLPTFSILYTEAAVVLGMVYNFLPFMVLPIYSVLSKTDKSLIEAAEDLGATPLITFTRVIFPLSLPGVMSGITMVFMPAVTTFVISRLLGGAQFTLIGNLIEKQFLTTGDWGFGSAISMVLMVLILLSMGVMSRYEKENEGGGLW